MSANRTLALFIAAWLGVVASASAQSAIAGVVKDASGAVLPGVSVEVASPALIDRTRTAVTDDAGNYKIIQKDLEHSSSRYGDYVDLYDNVVVPNIDNEKDPKPPGTKYKGAPMPYFMRIVGGVGMHAGYLPGYPASHGCIRMPEFMAENFFNNVEVGTPVTVTP